MASGPTFSPNPYANFDVSQWQNPFSLYQNQALPWPSQYAGVPTDAMGQPIQPQPGMTLNSTPAQAPQAPSADPSQLGFNNALIQSMRQNMQANGLMGGQANGGGMGPAYSGFANNPMFGNLIHLQNLNNAMKQSGQAAPAAASGGNPGGLDAQSYLSLLANPGPVRTPGATVPQASSAQPGSGVLQAFLQNWKPAASGPGSQFQQGFGNALKRMGY